MKYTNIFMVLGFGFVWFSRYEGASVEGVNYIYILYYLCWENGEASVLCSVVCSGKAHADMHTHQKGLCFVD